MNPLTRFPAQPSVASVRSALSYHSSHRKVVEGTPALVTWVLPDGVAATALPAGGEPLDDWLRYLRHQGISVLVSLDPASKVDPALLKRCHMHAVICPLQASAEPPLDRTLALCAGVLRLLRQGDRVAIHCDGTLERTSVVAGALLLWMGRPLQEALDAARRLSRAVALSLEQEAFLRAFQVAIAGAEFAGAAWGRRLVG